MSGTCFGGDGYQLIFDDRPQLSLQCVEFADHLGQPRRRVRTVRVLADFQPQEFPQRDSPRRPIQRRHRVGVVVATAVSMLITDLQKQPLFWFGEGFPTTVAPDLKTW